MAIPIALVGVRGAGAGGCTLVDWKKSDNTLALGRGCLVCSVMSCEWEPCDRVYRCCFSPLLYRSLPLVNALLEAEFLCIGPVSVALSRDRFQSETVGRRRGGRRGVLKREAFFISEGGRRVVRVLSCPLIFSIQSLTLTL